MRAVSFLLLLGIAVRCSGGQFLNNRPYPTYSLESMPDTDFSCRDKILGGYYADSQTQCQMFHICVKVAGVGVQDFRFLCPNGTAFDQDHQICADWDDVDCDATTLYYASDNFDLYRLGSGFESKAVKYGEEEETFTLQRSETGDHRLNREHQASRINQQRDSADKASSRKIVNRNRDNEADIFKVSSSSNFFNNRNGGKEEDDYEDVKGGNVNQNRDPVQKRKQVRKQQRPVQSQAQQQSVNSQQPTPQRSQPPTPQRTQQQPVEQRVNKQQQNRPQQFRPQPTNYENTDAISTTKAKPTAFINNFAGSSLQPTTTRTTYASEEESRRSNVPKQQNNQRRPSASIDNNRQYTNADSLRQSTPLAVSTPAPFRHSQQNNQYQQTTSSPRTSQTENYPPNFSKQFYQASQQKSSPPKTQQQKQPENYSNPPVVRQPNNNVGADSHFDIPKIRPTTKNVQKQADYSPTTYSPRYKPKEYVNPTTFAPKVPFTQTTQLNHQNNQQNQQQQNYQNVQAQQPVPKNNDQRAFTNTQSNFNKQSNVPQANNQQDSNYNANRQSNQNPANPTFNHQNHFTRPFANQFANVNKKAENVETSTLRTTAFTQYTPTVPQAPHTTPVARSNRYDETQYDDGLYHGKYDNYDNDANPAYKEDEFLKTAHSQNIASSRNEFVQNAKKNLAPSTQKQFYTESPRPFSVNANENITPEYKKPTKQFTPKPTDFGRQAQRLPQSQNEPSQKVAQQQQQQQQQQQPQQQANQSSKTQAQPQQSQPVKPKSDKNVSYDYAYYDTNVGNDPEYDIDTDFKKTTVV